MTTTIAPSVGQTADFLQLGPGASASYGAIDLRRAMGPGLQEGIVGVNGGAYKVTLSSGMILTIAASTLDGALVLGDSITAQGLYFVPPHSAAILETVTAAHATLPRLDKVVLEVLDANHDGGASNLARVRIIAGTATAGTTLDNGNDGAHGAPALPASALLLADVLVPAAAASILAGNIRDRRKWGAGAARLIERTSANYTTTGAVALIDSTNLNPRVECSGVRLRMALNAELSHSSASGVINFWPYVDSAQIAGHSSPRLWTAPVASGGIILYVQWEFTPAVGSHLLGWAWSTGGATATLNADATKPLQYTIDEVVRSNADNT